MQQMTPKKELALKQMKVIKAVLRKPELVDLIIETIDTRGIRSGRRKEEEIPDLKVVETIKFPAPKSDIEKLVERVEDLEKMNAIRSFKEFT